MCNQPHITFDTSVLAVPQFNCLIEDVYSYIDTILDWSRLLDDPWFTVSLTENGPSALSLDEMYPLRDNLKELFEIHSIIAYDVNTVSRVIDRLLNLTPSFETYFKIKEILYDQFETTPEIIRFIASKHLKDDLSRCLLLIAILRKHCRQPIGGQSLIIRKSPDKIIRVRAMIHDFEHSRDDIEGLLIEPEYFEGDVLTCDNFIGLIECLDESAILMGSVDNQGMELAIRIFACKEKIKNNEEPEWGKIAMPRIGREFRQTCQQCCNHQGVTLPPRILRSILFTIENQRLGDVHALREGNGANDPQRMRSRDKAVRRDIDYEFHLHYWDCDDGNIELASVVHHRDVSIPY